MTGPKGEFLERYQQKNTRIYFLYLPMQHRNLRAGHDRPLQSALLKLGETPIGGM